MLVGNELGEGGPVGVGGNVGERHKKGPCVVVFIYFITVHIVLLSQIKWET